MIHVVFSDDCEMNINPDNYDGDVYWVLVTCPHDCKRIVIFK